MKKYNQEHLVEKSPFLTSLLAQKKPKKDETSTFSNNELLNLLGNWFITILLKFF